MAFDLAKLSYTPDLRCVPAPHARLVCAMREAHMARAKRICCGPAMARYFGNFDAVRAFHVFMDEAGCAWPDPIVLNPPCQPAFSYDEMLLIDLVTAAAKSVSMPLSAI